MSNLSPAAVLYDSSGTEKGTTSNPVQVQATDKVSTGNASTTPLAGGATFTGAWEDVQGYGFMVVSAYADKDSASGGWQTQWSSDGSNTDASDTYELINTPRGRSLSQPVRGRYFRVVYTNGATAQGTFRLATLFRQNGSMTNTHPLNWSAEDTSEALLTRSVIVGHTTAGGGGYVNVKVNPSGALTVDVTGTVTANLGTIDGVATETTLSTLNTKVPSQGQAAMAASVPVVIANNQTAVPISAASLPLPTGAATSAKQPALGTAGTASTDVITVQGIASMTALKVDGSAVTQPVSGTVTANIGTIAGVATETTLAAINTKTPALGAAAKSGATPVTIATDDNGTVSTSNSSTSPLSGSATFTGTWEDISQQASISVIVSTDQIGTLYADFSTDGTNVDRTVQLSAGTDIPSGIHGLVPVAKYFRVRLINGSSAQTYLRVQSLLNRQGRMTLPISRMAQTLSDYSDVLNTRAGVFGKYQATPATLSDGARGDMLLDSKGRIVTSTPPSVRDLTTAALAAGATYTTPTFDTSNGQNYLSFSAYSTTDLNVFWDESSDGTNWATVEDAAVAAGDHNSDSHRVTSRYCRLRIVNGTTANAGGIANLYFATSLDTFGVQQDVALVDEFGGYVTSDKSWGLRVKTPDDTDAFGAGISHVRISQVSANFSQALTYNDVTSTVTGGGTTAQSNGAAQITSGTATTASAKLASNTTLSYTPGREGYAMFTAAFTAPTSAATTQSIGLYDTSNGFFIGYNGTTFGVTHRQNGVDTFYAKTSFNEDTLVGNVNSFFTRNSAPEAIDLTKKNVFRIRFGWLGAAPIRFEVMSPDGRWVRFHVIRYPNTSVAPSLYNPSLPFTAEVTKTAADATSLTINSSSWDAGIADVPNSDLDYTGSIAAANGTVTSNTRGKGTISFNVTGTWVGTLVIEGHNGDNSWAAMTGYTAAGAPVTSVTANSFFFVNCSAYSQVRIRASAWTSGTATLQTTATSSLVSVFTQTEGNAAAGAADTGNPLKIGGLAKTVQPTAVTDGQRSNILTDKLGRQVVTHNHIRDLVTSQTTTITNSSAETTILTATAATFNDLTSLVITNAGNTGTTVSIRDATAGTIRAVYYLPAQGGMVLPLPTPWKQTTVNNNWTATLGTATVTVYFHVIAVQNI